MKQRKMRTKTQMKTIRLSLWLVFLIAINQCCYASNLQFKTEESSHHILWWLVIIALATTIVGLFFLQMYRYKPKEESALQLLEKKRLNPQTHVYVMRYETQTLLIVENNKHIAITNLSST